MANSKSAATKPRRKAGSGTSDGSAPSSRSSSNRSAKASSRSKPAAKSGRSAKSSSGASASKQGTSKTAAKRIESARSTAAKRVGQAAGTAKQAAVKAKGPAVVVGAAAAGVAGGLALKGRMGRNTVLGVPVPRSLGDSSLPDLDVRSVAKTIGEASQRFARTSKAVSKDIERAGDQAERIGRMLA
jgi:hypothetical protein